MEGCLRGVRHESFSRLSLYDCSEDDIFWTCTLLFFHGVRMQIWDFQQMTALHVPVPLIIELEIGF